MSNANGMMNWVFCDGDLPPSGVNEPLGHEALMVTNLNDQEAHLSIDILFEDKPSCAVHYSRCGRSTRALLQA